jgi:SMC interacting uncharacterized protein involved in chromosome segregation
MLLKHPSTKEFFDVLRFLVLQVDPMVDIPLQHPEDAVPILMKQLKYPVEVNKSKLQAISGMNIWSQLLAVLGWFVDIACCLEGVIRPVAECRLICGSEHSSCLDDVDHSLLEQLQTDYRQYMLHSEHSSSGAEHLKLMCQHKMEGIQAESARLVQQHEEMEQRLERFRDESEELAQLKEAPAKLEEEALKLRSSIQSQEREVSSIELETSALEEEQQVRGQELEELEVQMRQLAEQVESQPWSKQDLTRFKAERDHLRKLLADIRAEAEREEQSLWEHGIEDSRLIDSLERAVRRVAEFGDTLDSDAGAPLQNLRFDASADELASIDVAAARKALQSQAVHHQEQVQVLEGQLLDNLDRLRVAQEGLSEEQRQCAQLQARKEGLQRRREESRGWSAQQLEDACRTAEATEDGTEASSCTDSTLLREAAQVDELRLRLAELRQTSGHERRQLEDLLRREQEQSQEHRHHIQKELQEASRGADALHKWVMQQLEETKREKLKEIKAPRGGC